MSTYYAALLPDGHRLHLQEGPIDLIIGAEGDRAEVDAAYAQAVQAFDGLLAGLVAELPLLRAPIAPSSKHPRGRVAKSMADAVGRYRDQFVTPMAAVAGAVADEICKRMVEGRTLTKAYVNNGGDIALHLSGAADYHVGIVAQIDKPAIAMTATISADQPIRGIASSGWQGRSRSLGIADAVTVLAPTSAAADVAATLIANAVNPGPCAEVIKLPALDLDLDTDLGELPVTVHVGTLTEDQIDKALENGSRFAQGCVSRGLISAAALCLRGQVRTVGALADEDQIISPTPIRLPVEERVHAER